VEPCSARKWRSGMHILAGILTAGLLIYLSMALLMPERFQ
jgi:K+-transporting ATPase KdpF subunit